MGILIGEAGELNVNSQDVCNFYKKNTKTALSNYSFYKWQFTESPSDSGDDHCMVAIDDISNQLIGVMGLNTRPFLLNGSVMEAAELTTWIVNKSYLGKGIGAKILNKIQHKYDILFGMGISDMALPIYMRSGFRYIRAIPRFIRVFNLNAVAAYAQYSPWAIKLIKYWSTAINDVPFEIGCLSEEKIRILEDIVQKDLNYFCRDYNYLKWRYSQHPVFDYKQFIVYSKNKGQGVFVCFREEKSLDNMRILHVLDFFGDQKDMPAALSYIHDYCRMNNFHLVDFFCISTRVNRHFISSGWFSVNDDSCFQFPHLFHPIEMRVPPTTSLIYWSKTNFRELADISRLYITKQDADFDRPTMDTYKNGDFDRDRPSRID